MKAKKSAVVQAAGEIDVKEAIAQLRAARRRMMEEIRKGYRPHPDSIGRRILNALAALEGDD